MSKVLLKPFEDYQKARFAFVQSIADLSQRPQNIVALHSAGVMSLLKPLLLDSVQIIQQSAALAIGRLANYSEEIAESVVQNDIITQLIYSLSNQNRFYKKAACWVLRAIAKHSAQLADDVVKSGALDPLIQNLSEFDPSVKESAVWALGYIAKHTESLAKQVVEARAIEYLILCLQEQEVTLKRAAAQTLSFIAQHSEELAIKVTESGNLQIITYLLTYNDIVVKKNIYLLLGNISKHSIDLANIVWNTVKDQRILLAGLMDPDISVKKNAAFCICEIVNKGHENARNIVDIGGLEVLVNYVANVKGDARLYGIIALGFIAAHNEKLAEAIINCKGVKYLKDALENEPANNVKAAACYALGQIAKHAPKHAKKVTDEDVLTLIMKKYNAPDSSDDLKNKAEGALKKLIMNCNYLPSLEPLLLKSPESILDSILIQYEKHLKNDKNYLRDFAQNGGLRSLLQLKPSLSENLRLKIDEVAKSYPEDLIKIYSPEYEMELKSAFDKYNP